MSQRTKLPSFNRKANKRDALMRSLMRSLIVHERISTTEAKAKAIRPQFERLITYGKKNTVASRRLAQSVLGDAEAVKKLFDSIAPRYAERHGGYTRIIKRTVRGANDARTLAYISLV